MSQWARNNPEQYEQAVDWLDARSDLSDREKPSEQDTCRYCGCDLIEGAHRPGCRLFVPVD